MHVCMHACMHAHRISTQAPQRTIFPEAFLEGACGSGHWQLGPVAHVAVVTQRLTSEEAGGVGREELGI